MQRAQVQRRECQEVRGDAEPDRRARTAANKQGRHDSDPQKPGRSTECRLPSTQQRKHARAECMVEILVELESARVNTHEPEYELLQLCLADMEVRPCEGAVDGGPTVPDCGGGNEAQTHVNQRTRHVRGKPQPLELRAPLPARRRTHAIPAPAPRQRSREPRVKRCRRHGHVDEPRSRDWRKQRRAQSADHSCRQEQRRRGGRADEEGEVTPDSAEARPRRVYMGGRC